MPQRLRLIDGATFRYRFSIGKSRLFSCMTWLFFTGHLSLSLFLSLILILCFLHKKSPTVNFLPPYLIFCPVSCTFSLPKHNFTLTTAEAQFSSLVTTNIPTGREISKLYQGHFWNNNSVADNVGPTASPVDEHYRTGEQGTAKAGKES